MPTETTARSLNGRSWGRTQALGCPRPVEGAVSLHLDIGWSSLIRFWVRKGMNDPGVPWYEFRRQLRPSVLILIARDPTLQKSQRERTCPCLLGWVGTWGWGRGGGAFRLQSSSINASQTMKGSHPHSLIGPTSSLRLSQTDRIRITVIAGSIY